MKTISREIFSFNELNDEAKGEAIKALQEKAENDLCLLEVQSGEMLDSLKAICKAFNLRLMDYSFGVCCRSHEVKISNYDIEDLEGHKAQAYALQVLIRHGYERPKNFSEMEFPGIVGFTGVCYDDELVQSIWESLMDGETIRGAFGQLSIKLCDMLYSEYVYLTSEEAVRDYLDEDEEQFTKDGELD